MSGLFWTFSQQFSVQGISFFVQIILARILMPSDFGLIAMLTVFIAIGNSLVDSGLTSSLIRTKDADQRDYSTVFFMNLVGSAIVYLILCFAAPFIAEFYNQPLLEGVLRVYTLTFIIRAFSQVQQTRLTKQMNFKLQMMIQVPSIIISGISGIYMAYQGLGVWALVWMNIIQSVIVTIQLWVRSKWHPSWVFDLNKLKYHFGFGYRLTLSGLLNTTFKQIYTVVIGKYFSSTMLGYYNRAETLRLLPVQNLSNALNKVTYPLFASLQDDDKKLKIAYQKLMQQVIFWLAPMMIGLMVLAEPLFRLLLTEKWVPAVPFFQLMCISGIMYPLHAYNLNILNVKGRSDLFLRLEIAKKTVTAIGIACAVPFGIYGLLYFQIISTFISFYINTYYSGRMIDYGIREQIQDILPMVALASFTGGILWFTLRWVLKQVVLPDWAILLSFGSFYSIIYFAGSFMLKMPALFDFKHLVLKNNLTK